MENNPNTINNQPTAGGLSSLLAPPQRGIRPSAAQRGPVRRVGGVNPMQAAPSQASIIKSVQQILPKMQNDAERQTVREQIVDALIRDPGSLNPERLQELNKMIQDHLSEQQQQSKQSQSNDECSSGGTTPTLNRQNIDNSENLISQILKIAMWLEEAIYDKFNDSKAANYRTLVRRLTQTLRSRDGGPQKQALMACSDAQQVNHFVQDILNQRAGGPSGGPPHMRQGGNFGPGPSSAQESSAASNAPSQFGNAGNAAGNSGSVNQQNNQEQSAQSVPNPRASAASNPFGAPGRGMGMPRAAAQRGRPRFAPPMGGRFAAPMGGGAQLFPQPPLPHQTQAHQSTNLQNHEELKTNSALEQPPPPQNNQEANTLQSTQIAATSAETISWTPQKQMIESGSADDSSVLLTPSSPKNKNTAGAAASGYQQDPNGNKQNESSAALKEEQQEKDAGSGQIGLDFFDQLGNGSGSIGERTHDKTASGQKVSPDLDFLEEYINRDERKNEEGSHMFFQAEQQEQSSNLQNHQISNQNSQGHQFNGNALPDENLEAPGKHSDGRHTNPQEEIYGLPPQEEGTVQVGANGEDQEGEQRPDIDRAPSNQNQEESINQQMQLNMHALNTVNMQQLQSNQAFIPESDEPQSESLHIQPQSNHQMSNNAEHQQEQRSGQSQNGAPALQENNIIDQHNDNNFREDGLISGGVKEHEISGRQGSWSSMNIPQTQQYVDDSNLNMERSGLNAQQNINDLAGETGSHATKQNFTYINMHDPNEAVFNKQALGRPGQNDAEYAQRKISSGKNSSKPQSGRMTPPSGRSGGKSNIAAAATNPNCEKIDLGAGPVSTSQSNHDETGSVSIDQNTNDKMILLQGHKDSNIKNGATMIPAEDLMSMDNRVASMSFVYRQSSIPEVWTKSVANPKECQSEFKAKPAQNSQVEGFMQSHQISMPPESVAPSMASVPVTSFEDTQQMLRAYKKKKRELAKTKETLFKIETEYVTAKQSNNVLEEELSQTQKRLVKAEKQLKQSQKQVQQKDNSLTEKQLLLKTKEAGVFQKELANQKQENQKLREKIRDLLKKCSNTGSSQGGGITDDSINKAAEIQLIQQQHSLDLQRERESFEQQNKQITDEMNYYKSKCSSIEQELAENRNASDQQREQERQVRQRYEQQIEQLNINSQNQMEQIREATRRDVYESVTNNANIKESELNLQIQQLTSEKGTLYSRLDDAQMISTNLQNEVNESRVWIEQLNKGTADLRDSQNKLQSENIELKQTVTKYESQSQDKTGYIKHEAQAELSSQNPMSSSKDFSIQPEGKDSKKSSSLADRHQMSDNKVSSQSAQDNLEDGQRLFEQDASTNSWQVLGDGSDQHSNAHYGTQNASHQSNKLQSAYIEQQHQPSDQPINASPPVTQINSSSKQLAYVSKDLAQPDHHERMRQPFYASQSNEDNSNLMIQSQYFPNYQQQPHLMQAIPQAPEESPPSEGMLKPRKNEAYDFTLEEVEQNKQTQHSNQFGFNREISDPIERSDQNIINTDKGTFWDGRLNSDDHPSAQGLFEDDQTNSANMMGTIHQAPQSDFFANPIPARQQYKYQPSIQTTSVEVRADINTGQSAQPVISAEAAPNTTPMLYNNDPYNFFDDDDVQEDVVNNQGDNVIPNSMFD